MVVAIDPSVPFIYVFRVDRKLPPEQQTHVLIRPMTVKDGRGFFDRFKGKEQVDVSYDDMLDYLDKYVVGWNLKFPDGTLVPFDTTNPDRWNYLPYGLVTELFGAIVELNQIGETARKN